MEVHERTDFLIWRSVKGWSTMMQNNQDFPSTGPLARPFARLLITITPHRSLRTARFALMLRSAHSCAHSLARAHNDSRALGIGNVCMLEQQAILNHSAEVDGQACLLGRTVGQALKTNEESFISWFPPPKAVKVQLRKKGLREPKGHKNS